MRLDFNVLWIDDQPEFIKSLCDKITRRLRKEGFELNPRPASTVVESLTILKEAVFHDEVDLVLVDYSLGGGPQGDSALKEIRKSLPYRDIVFYSAKSPSELRELAYKQGVEGVYCSHRDYLDDTVVEVFEMLVKKVIDIDHMRGIVMGATAEIDITVHDCLWAIHNSCDPDGQNAFLQQARKRVSDNADEMQKKHSSALTKELADLLSDREVLTADHKLRFLIRRLKQFDNLRALRKHVVDYQSEIIPKRNQLAHARLARNSEGIMVFEGSNGLPITAADMKKIRCDLLDYRAAFKELLESLSNFRE